MKTLKIQLLTETAKLPERANATDAGLDLFADEFATIPVGRSLLIKTGIAIQLEPGYEAQIRPRSGLALKAGITVLNTPGTIDAGYRGEVGVILINHGDRPFQVHAGMKIAQMMIARVELPEVERVLVLDDSTRGANGFGSTGI